MSIRRWLIIFLVFSFTIPLSIAAFNIYTDFDMHFNYPNSLHRKYMKQAVAELNRGNFLQVNQYHVPQSSFLRGWHLATNTPDILLFGTSRLMLLSSEHLPSGKLKFINSSIQGGGVSEMAGKWQQYRVNVPSSHKASYAFVEVYPVLYLEPMMKQPELFIELANIHLARVSQQQIKRHIRETKGVARKNLFSSSYLSKNIYYLARPSFTITLDTNDIRRLIAPDGSYILSPITFNKEAAIRHGLNIKQMRPTEMPTLPLIKALTLDILAHGIIPILIIPSYHPLTYDLATDGNDLLQTIEADVLAFAKEHDIMVVGSFSPHPYNLDASYFRDANHSTAEMWEVLFADFIFPEPIKIDNQYWKS